MPRTGDEIDLNVEAFDEGDEVVLSLPDPVRPGRPRRFLARITEGRRAKIITTRVSEKRKR